MSIKSIKYKKIGSINRKTVLFCLIYLAALVFVLWKCKYGFGKKDEALYLTTTYRLVQGDALLFDEQHRSQLYSFILYPIFKLYCLITKNNMDGVLINFRYIYVITQFVFSIIILIKLRKISNIGAYISSLIFLLYAPYNLMALSYNTICYQTLILSLLLLLDKNRISYFISGIFFSLSVLCHPFLAILYFGWSIIVAFYKLFKKDLKYTSTVMWTNFTFGVLLAAVIFIGFCLSRVSLSQIITSLPQIIIDPEYPTVPILNKIKEMIYSLIAFTDNYAFLFIYIGFFVLTLLYLLDKNKKENRSKYLIVGIVLDLIALIITFVYSKLINYIIFPLNILGLYCFVLFNSNENKKLFYIYFIPSMFYCISIFFSSDCEMKAISSASIVCLMVSIIMICKALDSINTKKAALFVYGTLIAFLFMLICERYLFVFNNVNIAYNNMYVFDGPYKGVYAREAQYDRYYNDLKIMDKIKNCEGKSVVFLSQDNWMYLMASEYRNAGPSSWKTCFPYYLDSINDYYSNDNHNKPDIIYINKKDFSNYKEVAILRDYKVYYESQDEAIYTR